MIQRIQSLYLTFIIILSLLLLSGGILKFADESGSDINLSSAGILTDPSQKIVDQIAPAWPVTALLIMISFLSLVAVFMFRFRKIQILLTISVIILSAVLITAISWFGFTAIHNFRMTFSPGINMTFPVLILIFAILGLKGIQKDDRLVRSYDRLR